jgi:hypothetical protein
MEIDNLKLYGYGIKGYIPFHDWSSNAHFK